MDVDESASVAHYNFVHGKWRVVFRSVSLGGVWLDTPLWSYVGELLGRH